jgi:hypothetical protein
MGGGKVKTSEKPGFASRRAIEESRAMWKAEGDIQCNARTNAKYERSTKGEEEGATIEIYK